MTKKLPLIAPNPVRLSERIDALRAIEESGIYSNGGPVVRGFEAALVERMFGGEGEALAVANATLGLMIAIRQAAGARQGGLAIMPAMTFAATAHAAEWAGLTPLIVDIDPNDWTACAAAEEAALKRYGDRVAAMVPYATFGASIDLDRYRRFAEHYGVGVVVDAAASLGSSDAEGCAFGRGSAFPIVYSMHATKAFATAEGGVIYSTDKGLIAELRRMTNFGFGDRRRADGPGLNAKLSEVHGLMAQGKLEDFDAVAAHRAALVDAYRAGLADYEMQHDTGMRQAAQFMPVLVPADLTHQRRAIQADLEEQGIGSATYFSPHLGEQPHFRGSALMEPTPVANRVSARILSLPITEAMTVEDVGRVCVALNEACARARLSRTLALGRSAEPGRRIGTLVIGGGPAGTALLTAASKVGRIEALAGAGLMVVERSAYLGGGNLGHYAITSDTTAGTFLSAVKDNPYAELAELMEWPSARQVAAYEGKLGVPLPLVAPFLADCGDRLGALVERHGGELLTRHEVVEAQRLAGGGWGVRVRAVDGGEEKRVTADNIVVATGGYQAAEDLSKQALAGSTIGDLAGERLWAADDFMRLGGIERLRLRLGENRAPRIAIIGASTSAVASAVLMLKASPALPLGQGAITIVHRQPLRPFYPSVEAAHADGYFDFTDQDLCPLSGFVHRLAGFRLESRELALRMLSIGGRTPDPRVSLIHSTPETDAEVRAAVEAADIVVAALGYRPCAARLLDVNGSEIALMAHDQGRPRMVDQQCRVMDAEGRPLPGAYGIGLAAGFVPMGRLGGEPNFKGKANGLWLWQNDIGQLIVDQLLADRKQAAA